VGAFSSKACPSPPDNGVTVTAVSAGFVLTRWPRYRDFMLYIFLAVTVGFAGLCLLEDTTPIFVQEALLVLPALG